MSFVPPHPLLDDAVWLPQDMQTFRRGGHPPYPEQWFWRDPVFGETGPFATQVEAEADCASRHQERRDLEAFARLIRPSDWQDWDLTKDRRGFGYDALYASLRQARHVLAAWAKYQRSRATLSSGEPTPADAPSGVISTLPPDAIIPPGFVVAPREVVEALEPFAEAASTMTDLQGDWAVLVKPSHYAYERFICTVDDFRRAAEALAALPLPGGGKGTFSPDPAAEAAERLARFAKGEAMQDVWSGPYPPDGIRADLRRVLAPAANPSEAQG